MRTTREEALRTLGLHDGASADDIRLHYKKLALRWHPDKNHGNKEATKRFQDVSAAYKKLTSDVDTDIVDDEIMSWAEMMQLFAQMFTCRNSRHHHHHCCDDYDDTYDGDYTDDEDDDDDDYYFTEDSEEDYDDDEILDNIANRLRNKFEAKRYTGKATSEDMRRPITEEEALRNARELIEQEETEKQKEERKKAKRKKKKEKRKQREKEKKIQEEEEKLKQEAILAKKKAMEMAQAAASAAANKKRNETTNNPPNTQKENKAVKEEKGQTQERPSSNKHHSRCSAVSNGFVSNKKENHKKKPNDLGSSDDDKIDTKSAFFARAASKAPVVSANNITVAPTPTKDTNEPNKNIKKDSINTQKDKIINKSKNKEEKVDEKPAKMDPVVFKSRQNAVEGNRLAQSGDFVGAVKMFTEAIQLDPSDFRFFGNRSYCCDRLGQFERALKDANEAVSLAPEWPKGYFRKGRALAGLKRYEEAETAFQDVLKLGANCEDAQFELARVRVQILIEMGFDSAYSEEAIKLYSTVQAACDALISGKVNVRSMEDEVYYSDEDKKATKTSNISKLTTTPMTQVVKPSNVSSDQFNETNYEAHNGLSDTSQFSNVGTKKTTNSMPFPDLPQGQARISALWVGNVEPSRATDKTLAQVFSTCGKVTSVRILPSKYCAFVNYASAESAATALEKLQGVKFCDQNLLLRYPNNQPPPFSVTKPNATVITNGQKSTTPAKPASAPPVPTLSTKSSQKLLMDSKVTGPVNGNECYFWRTTGCVFNDRCRYDHFPDSKGVDLNKVKAKYGKGM